MNAPTNLLKAYLSGLQIITEILDFVSLALKDTKGLNEEDYTILNVKVVRSNNFVVAASISERGILLVIIVRYIEWNAVNDLNFSIKKQ